MATVQWKKIENEAGYACYVDELRGVQQFNHPSFYKIKDAVDAFDNVDNSMYCIAFKVFTLQKYHKVPSLRICSGVFARHQLSLSEASLSLDSVELEAVLSDIYFAAEKDGQFSGDRDLVVDLLINLLLNIFDENRKEPIKVQAVKTVLILLCDESASNKWLALANCASDHNGCVSPRRLGLLLNHISDFLLYLGHSNNKVTSDVDLCFNKNGGMLGATAHSVAEWGLHGCSTTTWLPVVQRIQESRQIKLTDPQILIINCAGCSQPLTQTLLFKCMKCLDTYFCENCYLFCKNIQNNGHKEAHFVQEITDDEMFAQTRNGFMEGMRRFFFCTKTKKKHVAKTKSSKKDDKKPVTKKVKTNKESKPVIFTSTVGKASGTAANNVVSMLQDIINKLESQNRALQDLSVQLQDSKDPDVCLQTKVNTHWNMISLEINRLKMLKDNLQSPSHTTDQKSDKIDRPQAFDLFSPIPVVAESKLTDNLINQPRVLSMDSGNFSVTSKHTESKNLLTLSGDALKPVTRSTTTNDTISNISMNDISDWYNETESLAPDKTRHLTHSSKRKDPADLSIMTTEQKYAADNLSVETSNDKMKELNADLDNVLDRLQEILTNNFAVDDSCFDNNQLRETANEMEGLLGSLIRGVEKRATMNATKTMV